MWVELIIILGIYAPYYAFIKFIGSDWGKWKEHKTETAENTSLTIIIPFRNEITGLLDLISSLNSQISSMTKVILVNDHSTDDCVKLVTNSINSLDNFRAFSSNETGKKAALTTGIKQADSDWILTLDADVILPSQWFSEIKKALNTSASMVILPVTISGDESLLQKFEVFDFLALQGFTFSTHLASEPFLANGAHLAFKKSIWDQLGGYESHPQIASGDDVFLLETFRKNSQKIDRVWNKNLLVATDVCANWKEFLHQRVRWGSKTASIDSKESRKFALIISVANIVLVLLALFGSLRMAIFGLIAKSLADIRFIVPVLKTYQRRDLIKFSPLFALYYPFYFTFVGIATLIITPKWKGRRVK